MIDLHCHVLPGLDDGPATMEEAVALVRAQAEAGVRTIVATSHVSWEYPDVTAARIAEAVAAVNAAVRDAALPVEVLAGAEVALTRAVDLSDDELQELYLGDGRWLLLEPPFSPAAAAGAEQAIASLLARGHRLVLAHPERCPGLLADRGAVERLVHQGAICSLTAGSLTGRFGRDARRFALELLGAELAHNVASDAHGMNPRRPPGMAGDVREAGLEPLLDWLCRGVPEAVLGSGPLPPRPKAPAPQRSRGGLSRLLRRA